MGRLSVLLKPKEPYLVYVRAGIQIQATCLRPEPLALALQQELE